MRVLPVLPVLRSVFLGWMLLFSGVPSVSGHGALIDPPSRNILAFEGKYPVGKYVGPNPITPPGPNGLNSLDDAGGPFYEGRTVRDPPLQKMCGGRSSKSESLDNPFSLPGTVVTPLAPGKIYRIRYCIIFLHVPGRINAGLCPSDKLEDCLKIRRSGVTRAVPLKLANANGKSGDETNLYPEPHDGHHWGGYNLALAPDIIEKYPVCRSADHKRGSEVVLEAMIPNIECPKCVLQISWETGTICRFRDSPHEWFTEKYETGWQNFRHLPDARQAPRPICWEQEPPEMFVNCADVSITAKGSTNTSTPTPTADDEDMMAVYATLGSVASSVLSTACIASLLVFMVGGGGSRRRRWG